MFIKSKEDLERYVLNKLANKPQQNTLLANLKMKFGKKVK